LFGLFSALAALDCSPSLKCAKIVRRPGSAYSAPPDFLVGFRGGPLCGGGRRKREMEEKEGKEKRRRGKVNVN